MERSWVGDGLKGLSISGWVYAEWVGSSGCVVGLVRGGLDGWGGFVGGWRNWKNIA